MNKVYKFFVIVFAVVALLALTATLAKADYLFSLTGKYGANGYTTSGNSGVATSTTNSSSTDTTVNNGHHTTTSTTNSSSSTNSPYNTTTVGNRYQVVPGLRLQTLPDSIGGLSVGAGYYFDNTIEGSIGIRF